MHDRRHGIGKLTFPDGNNLIYNNIRHYLISTSYLLVNSTLTGSVYTGEFEDDHKHGNGEFHYADGSFYKGQFMHDKWHGTGDLYDSGGVLTYSGNCAHIYIVHIDYILVYYNLGICRMVS